MGNESRPDTCSMGFSINPVGVGHEKGQKGTSPCGHPFERDASMINGHLEATEILLMIVESSQEA